MTARSAGEEARPVGWAIFVGTVVQAVSFGSLMVGVFASTSDSGEAGGVYFALGFMLVPIMCAVVAFMSRHPRAPMATLKGMGAWLVIGLPLGLLIPVVGLGMGYTAAGALTLRSDALAPGRNRAWAILAVAIYLTVLLLILPQSAILGGAISPLLAIRAADIVTERRELQT
ncbi:MAG: hypothetical protein PVG83_13025 [Acidimicrobiia bacterium]